VVRHRRTRGRDRVHRLHRHHRRGQVVALVKGRQGSRQASAGDAVTVIVNQTPFYGESGGQIRRCRHDHRRRWPEAAVTIPSKPLGRLHAHHATVEAGTIRVGDTVQARHRCRAPRCDPRQPFGHAPAACRAARTAGRRTSRRRARWSRRDRLRFDFSHPTALTAEDIAAIEAEVNAEIRANEAVSTRLMTPDDAIEAGAMALFGEKYGDEVRVLSDGPPNWRTRALFGRTVRRHPRARHRRYRRVPHRFGKRGQFGRAPDRGADRRRRAPVAGRARRCAEGRGRLLRTTPEDVEARVAALLDERRKLERELAEAKKALALGGGGQSRRGRGGRRREVFRPGARRP
jgi:alanyl-tRNA synthetase